MIYLSTEKGLVKVNNWADVKAIPGFEPDIDPKSEELHEPIGYYNFHQYRPSDLVETLIPCGLKSCHQPNGMGLIVGFKSGRVTNVGHQCGLTHFDFAFSEMERNFKRSIDEYNWRGSIDSFFFRLDVYKSKVSELKSGINSLIYKNRNILLNEGRGCPTELISFIKKAAKTRDGSIYKDREATEREIEQLETAQGRSFERPQYVSEIIGKMDGIELFYSDHDLKPIIADDLYKNISAIENFNPSVATGKELKFWSKWVSEIDSKIERAEKILSYGKLFFSKSNLHNLLKIECKLGQIELRKWLDTLAIVE